MKRAPGPPSSQEKPRQPGRIRAVFLAAVVHAGFLALIVFGVTWQSRPEIPVQAELWAKLPPAPKAKAAEPAKVEPPEPEPPKPEPLKPPPPKPDPPKAKPPPPKPDPAIAQKLERDKREREKKKEDEARKVREKEDAAKKKREEEAKRKEDERAKREAEKAREEAAKARQSEIDRYKTAIQAKIRQRANVPDTVIGNPEVQVLIRVLPGGEVLDITITRRSGNPTYDSSIERGIRSASPLPVPPANSELFPQFRELNLNFRHER
ncbi:MAG TPA: TonB family protein [Usitatibacter sp.]|nr:TonB family protein [Usitatibacter sp.]